MPDNELLYQLSLCEVPHIGHVHAKLLCETYGSASNIFRASQSSLERVEGIGEVRARSIKHFRDFRKAEKELAFIRRYDIRPLFIADDHYPKRLLNCYDPPVLLFFKGNVNLNAPRMISVVGTRNHSEYGRWCAERLVKELAACGVVIVSGLAFGIDSVAHKSALKAAAPTIGVMGHGLNIIYPPENTNLAREMLSNGGLLTEFKSNTKPDKHNFPCRNRVVAGISDATVVVESGIRGGSIITAEIAHGYNRDVFAVPGRVIDGRSAGCNHLIRSNKAILLSEPAELLQTLGWSDEKAKLKKPKLLFSDLSDHEKQIVALLQNKESVPLEQLNTTTGIRTSELAAALLNLEMLQVTQSLPGKRFRLTDQQLSTF